MTNKWQRSLTVMGLALLLGAPLSAQQRPALSSEQAVKLNYSVQQAKRRIATLQQQSKQWRMQLTSHEPGEGDLHGSGSADVMQRLEEIEQRLEEMQEAIRDIQGWIEGQTESLMVMANDITEIKRFRAGNYVQFQYRDTNEPGGTPDAFALRRFRISQTNVVDPRTSMRLSFDVATGTDTLQAQLRDAQLIYDIEPSDVKVGVQLLLGQQPLPLGYELERSSGDREFPERTFYNRTMFNGERSRGLYLRYGTSLNSLVHLGVWDALTYNDPEQRGRAPGVASRLAMTGGFRVYSTVYDFGVSVFAGKRPSFTAGNQTSPEVDRRFVFIDASYIGLFLPQLFVRGEVMFGKDRVPSTTASPTSTAKDMLGWHVVLGYNISARNQIAFRYEQFDANRDTAGNAVHGYGAAYIYYINPGARFTAAYEVFFDPARRPNRYHATTLRLQFRM